VGIELNLNLNNSKIEGSFIVPEDIIIIILDIDVSYVDGYSVLITCSSQGIAVTGYNIELFKQPSAKTKLTVLYASIP
jgi:hypothetical protein